MKRGTVTNPDDNYMNNHTESDGSDFSAMNFVPNYSSSSEYNFPNQFNAINPKLNYDMQDMSMQKNSLKHPVQKKSLLYSHAENKIEHIFTSRISENGLEYLILFQNQEQFSTWVPSEIAKEFPNFVSKQKKFNETTSNRSLFSFNSPNINTSYKSILKILSHRLIGTNNNSSLEFLYMLNTETGSSFFWEPVSVNSPQLLIQNYLQTRVCVENTHPPRPSKIVVTEEIAKGYISSEGKTLRNYQIEGINWMLSCFCANHGCILADEMGLGKTIQTLVYLNHLNRYTEFHGPSLIAVGTNTFDQWCAELEKWTKLKYVSYTGLPDTRSVIQQYQMPFFNDLGIKQEGRFGFNVLLVTYDIFLKDIEFFSTIEWQNIIVDEGHRIKNCDGKKHNALLTVKAMNRIILTGTPIQNTMLELWTLLQFVSPEYFPEGSAFPTDDVESLDAEIVSHIKNMIAPHLLRRSLNDVETTMLPKDERIALLHLTRMQEDLIRLTQLHQLGRIKNGGEIDSLQESNTFQRICNHPFLIEGVEDYFMTRNPGVSKLDMLINTSAKFIFLDRVLPCFKKQGRSVLIFSQKVKVLKLLEEYCQLKRYTYEILNGNLSEQEKKEAISKFCDNSGDAFIFLISTRSGAEGLNLTRANVTIVFDPDWNPQNDIQALGRCHRIGQTQKVDVIRLLTFGTYEHEMYVRSQRKLKLWNSILGDGKQIKEASRPPPAIVIDSSQKNSTKPESIINPQPRFCGIDFEGYGTFIKADEETEQVTETSSIYPVPPILETQFAVMPGETFDSVMERSATITKDVKFSGINSKNFPKIDITHGLTNEQFLNQFPILDQQNSSSRKQKARPNTVHVTIDGKMAKRILRLLRYYGFGEWEKIHQAIDGFCPIEQLTKFCSGAVLLHFRALEPSKVMTFPLLMNRLLKNIDPLTYTAAFCTNKAEWFNVFIRRSGLAQESKACKDIHDHIFSTAQRFLMSLENHLVIKEFARNPYYDLLLQILPPFQGRTREEDKRLVNELIEGIDINIKDKTRVIHILHRMRSVILSRNEPVSSFQTNFWLPAEIKQVVDTLKEFGMVMLVDNKTIVEKTALLSKSPDSVVAFVRFLVKKFHEMQKDKGPITITEEEAHSNEAPPDVYQTFTIESSENMNILRRIIIVQNINSVYKEFSSKSPEQLNKKIVEDNWMTYGDLLKFLDMITRYGCSFAREILLEPGFVEHLTQKDIQKLKSNEPITQTNDTNIPQFVLTDNAFYNFLRNILKSENSQQSVQQPQPSQQQPIQQQPIQQQPIQQQQSIQQQSIQLQQAKPISQPKALPQQMQQKPASQKQQKKQQNTASQKQQKKSNKHSQQQQQTQEQKNFNYNQIQQNFSNQQISTNYQNFQNQQSWQQPPQQNQQQNQMMFSQMNQSQYGSDQQQQKAFGSIFEGIDMSIIQGLPLPPSQPQQNQQSQMNQRTQNWNMMQQTNQTQTKVKQEKPPDQNSWQQQLQQNWQQMQMQQNWQQPQQQQSQGTSQGQLQQNWQQTHQNQSTNQIQQTWQNTQQQSQNPNQNQMQQNWQQQQTQSLNTNQMQQNQMQQNWQQAQQNQSQNTNQIQQNWQQPQQNQSQNTNQLQQNWQNPQLQNSTTNQMQQNWQQSQQNQSANQSSMQQNWQSAQPQNQNTNQMQSWQQHQSQNTNQNQMQQNWQNSQGQASNQSQQMQQLWQQQLNQLNQQMNKQQPSSNTAQNWQQTSSSQNQQNFQMNQFSQRQSQQNPAKSPLPQQQTPNQWQQQNPSKSPLPQQQGQQQNYQQKAQKGQSQSNMNEQHLQYLQMKLSQQQSGAPIPQQKNQQSQQFNQQFNQKNQMFVGINQQTTAAQPMMKSPSFGTVPSTPQPNQTGVFSQKNQNQMPLSPSQSSFAQSPYSQQAVSQYTNQSQFNQNQKQGQQKQPNAYSQVMQGFNMPQAQFMAQMNSFAQQQQQNTFMQKNPSQFNQFQQQQQKYDESFFYDSKNQQQNQPQTNQNQIASDWLQMMQGSVDIAIPNQFMQMQQQQNQSQGQQIQNQPAQSQQIPKQEKQKQEKATKKQRQNKSQKQKQQQQTGSRPRNLEYPQPQLHELTEKYHLLQQQQMQQTQQQLQHNMQQQQMQMQQNIPMPLTQSMPTQSMTQNQNATMQQNPFSNMMSQDIMDYGMPDTGDDVEAFTFSPSMD